MMVLKIKAMNYVSKLLSLFCDTLFSREGNEIDSLYNKLYRRSDYMAAV